MTSITPIPTDLVSFIDEQFIKDLATLEENSEIAHQRVTDTGIHIRDLGLPTTESVMFKDTDPGENSTCYAFSTLSGAVQLLIWILDGTIQMMIWDVDINEFLDDDAPIDEDIDDVKPHTRHSIEPDSGMLQQHWASVL